jgi:hypothetical protein
VRQVHRRPAALALATLPPPSHEALPGTAGQNAAPYHTEQQASGVVNFLAC